jgi:hypothetical protein
VELNDWFRESYTLVGDDVLAGIIAFGSAIPEEKLMQGRWGRSEVFNKLGTAHRSANTYVLLVRHSRSSHACTPANRGSVKRYKLGVGSCRTHFHAVFKLGQPISIRGLHAGRQKAYRQQKHA